MTTDELKKKYAEAETEINNIYVSTRAVSVISYQAKTKKKTDAVLNGLRKSTTEYCEKEIPRIYQDSLEQLEADLQDVYERGEDWHIDRAKQSETIENAKEDTESKLIFAIITAGLCLSAYTANASTQFDFKDVDGFRDSILSQIANNGINGGAYFRDGTIVNTNLSGYADEVLQGVDTMVGNDAVVDTLMANGWDLVKMSEHEDSCPICYPYQGRVYSLSGNSDEYPYLYDTGWNEEFQNFHPNCRHYLEPFFPDTQTPEQLEETKEYSNRSFEVGGEGWTKEQVDEANRMKDLYNAEQKKKQEIYSAKKQYDKYKAALGEKAPKSFNGFWRMKQADSEGYKTLKSEYLQFMKAQ